MKKFTIISIILIVGLQSYSQWTQQEINTNAQLNDVFFLNENIGWINGTNFETEQGIIFFTANAGITWDSISTVPRGDMELFFVDSLMGWGNLTWSSEAGLYETVDGGFNWDKISSEFAEYTDLDFVNADEGFFIERVENTLLLPSSLFKTNDGGETWQFIDSICGYSQDSIIFSRPEQIEFLDSNLGYVSYSWSGAGGFNGRSLMKTTDGGLTWEIKSFPFYAYYFTFINENIGYAYLYNSDLYRTNDGAESWEILSDQGVNSLSFFTPDNGWICVGESIKYTNDGGFSWMTQYSNESNILDICFSDSINGWAVGQNGLIVHTNNGGATGINETNFKNGYLKIYPNPSTELTNINFEFEKTAEVKLIIENIRGQKIKHIPLGTQKIGIYELNCSDFAPGVYFITLQTDKGDLTEKLIIE